MNKEQKRFWNALRKPFPKRKHCENCINFITSERVNDVACNIYEAGGCCNSVTYDNPKALKKWEWDCVHSD